MSMYHRFTPTLNHFPHFLPAIVRLVHDKSLALELPQILLRRHAPRSPVPLPYDLDNNLRPVTVRAHPFSEKAAEGRICRV